MSKQPKKYIVELSPGCWLGPWPGDPGRTLVERTANRYATKRGASIALGMARKFRPFLNAKIVEVGDEKTK